MLREKIDVVGALGQQPTVPVLQAAELVGEPGK
jgi:hypothetical protein